MTPSSVAMVVTIYRRVGSQLQLGCDLVQGSSVTGDIVYLSGPSHSYLFNTPSGAAAVVLGRTSNGWIDWKNGENKTLHDVKRVEAIEE